MALKLPDWGLDLINRKSRYKGGKGGRGSAKSHTFARGLLIKMMSKKTRVLCTREFQNSIKESVHQLLSDLINDPNNGFEGFTVLESEIRHENGSDMYFKGLARQIDSIKSMEGIDIVWIEEGQTISQRSLDILIPTIRKDGSEIWFTYNPDLDTDPIHVLATSGREDVLLFEVNWNHNPFISSVLIAEKDEAYRVNPVKASNVWGGQTRKNSDQQVIKNYKVVNFEIDEDFGPAYQGLDFGFSKDPLAFTRFYVHTKFKRIYVRYAIAKTGILPSQMMAFLELVPDAKKHKIIADSARPELIEQLRQEKFIIEGAKKGKGSVEDGVQWLQDHEIIIHPDCLKSDYATKEDKYTIDEEFSLYSFVVDKRTGLITTDLEDKNNHYTDSMRYGAEKFITVKSNNWGSIYG